MAQDSQNAKGCRHRNHGHYHKEYGNRSRRGESTQETEKLSFIPITPANFDELKKRIIKVIEDIQIEDLDIGFHMSLQNGILMGNHANKCDTCNIFHYLMAFVINKHRIKMGK